MSDIDDTGIRWDDGNLFADLGHFDAETHRLKAELVREVMSVMCDRGLTQFDVENATGLREPDVSRLLKGQFRELSVESIMSVLSRLGCEIDIVVKSSTWEEPSPIIHFHPVQAH